MTQKRWFKKWLYFFIPVLIALFILVYVRYISCYVQLSYIQEISDVLHNFVQKNYYSSVLLFIALLAIGTSLALPLMTLFGICAGFLFGWKAGLCYSLIGIGISSTVIFFATKKFLYNYFRSRYGRIAHSIEQKMERYKSVYLVMLRIIPLFPYFAMTVALSLLDITYPVFISTTVVGMSLLLLLYVFAGEELQHLSSCYDIFNERTGYIIAAVVVCVVVYIVIRKIVARIKQKNKK
jgi:uncharacterized membrane protein YdjX (TVP38/TMEM64 family)